MSNFKAKMYQIQFRLGLRPRTCWESLQCSQISSLDLRGLLKCNWREGKGKGAVGRGGRDGKRRKVWAGEEKVERGNGKGT